MFINVENRDAFMSLNAIKAMIVCCSRVSALEQQERLQTDALAKVHRPELDCMLDTIRE